jgi:dihydropteroate synthase
MDDTSSGSQAAPVPTAGGFEIMGILNVTPDSFSDGGEWFDAPDAVQHGLELIAAGAAIIDVGGESTRPGAAPVALDEELRRVIPAVEGIRDVDKAVKLSVDTSKAEVVRRALEAGATLVNDVSSLRVAPQIAEMTAAAQAELCLMHMVGSPRTMQDNPVYDDVVSEVKRFLEERMQFAVSHGVAEQKIILDPGIGFAKTAAHNLELIDRLDEIVALGRPVLIGTSRKSFLGQLTGRATGERLAATLATNVIAYERGARLFRVHDVAPHLDALTIAAAVG